MLCLVGHFAIFNILFICPREVGTVKSYKAIEGKTFPICFLFCLYTNRMSELKEIVCTVYIKLQGNSRKRVGLCSKKLKIFVFYKKDRMLS